MTHEQPRQFLPSEVPILDLEDYRSGQGRAGYLRDLSRALCEHGFLVVGGHGVDLAALDRCYAVSRAFFARPLADKERYLYTAVEQRQFGNLGYFPCNSERAVGWSLADTKEFFHMGATLPEKHPMRSYYTETPWPDHEGFRSAFDALFEQLRACGDLLFASVAEWGGLDTNYARALVDGGNHVMRTIHYPPIPSDGDAVWAAQHTGIQLLGLQPRTSHPGLEIALPSGEWVAPGDGFGDYLIINIGEMLAYLLSGRVKPTLHRVVSRYARTGGRCEDRYAIVFFYHGNALQTLRPVGAAGAATGETVQVGEWLRRRLVDLGLQPGRVPS